MARLTSFLHETITGQRIVKAFAMEDYEYGRFSRENESLFRDRAEAIQDKGPFFPVMEMLGGIAVALSSCTADRRSSRTKTTPGEFFSFTAALLMLYKPISASTKKTTTSSRGSPPRRGYSKSSTASRRLPTSRAPSRWARRRGDRIQNVSFKYEEKMVLKDINLQHRQERDRGDRGRERSRENHACQPDPAIL